MRILTACASALALAVGVPALSQGHGNGQRNGGSNAERGQDNGNNADRAQERNNRGRADPRRGNRGADRGNHGNGQADRGNRGTDRSDHGRSDERHADRRHDNDSRGRDDRSGHADRRNGGGNARRALGNARNFVERRSHNLRDAAERAAGRQRLVELRDRRDGRSDRRARGHDNDFYREHRWTDAAFRNRIVRVRDRQRSAWQDRFCPPGRARQNELCMPPGQYRKLYSYGGRFERTGYSVPDWYRNSYRSDPFYGQIGQGFDYRYADGYAYRIDPQTQLVTALLPVIGGALGLGQSLPTGYNVYNLPLQYRSVYPDNDYNYRYGDGAIYRVDPGNRTILGISELVSPGFTVGRTLPAGYGAYNVPYGYRDTYADTADSLYRYNNGRIYQVDPETQLVLAAIDLLT